MAYDGQPIAVSYGNRATMPSHPWTPTTSGWMPWSLCESGIPPRCISLRPPPCSLRLCAQFVLLLRAEAQRTRRRTQRKRTSPDRRRHVLDGCVDRIHHLIHGGLGRLNGPHHFPRTAAPV